MKVRIRQIVADKRILLVLFILFAVGASLQSYLGSKTQYENGLVLTKYNNYTIFEKSFEHLKNNQDLYIAYPSEHWDLYKYTPTFAVFFAIFHVFPDGVGLTLWNLLNALVLFFAVYALPRLNNYQKGIVLIVILLELMTSMQNEQSNALIAGLIVLAFALLEKNRSFWAALCIVFSVFIKLFGVVGLVLFLFYPKKARSILYGLFWTIVLLALPLLFVSIDQYTMLIESYLNLLTTDHDASYGYSVMGWLHTWFALEIDKKLIVAVGAALFLLPLYRIHHYKTFLFRYLMLSSVLVWVVIFNHKAESPTFIIAMTGVALWFVLSQKNWLNIALFVSAFVLTSLSPTDLFPKYLRDELVNPYTLKAVPCILIWVKMTYDLLSLNKDATSTESAHGRQSDAIA